MEKVVLERIGRKIQFSNLFVAPRHNTRGGLALYWPEDMNVDVQTFSARHIDAIIELGVNDAWQFTGFYGDPETANRESSWSLLRLLSQRSNLPWVCIGDFNEILFAEEKQGWLIRPERQMQGFRDALDYCRLRDLGFNGFLYTWCNRRPGGQNVWIRLDREVASVEWILRFPTARIHHLDAFHSDHKSLLLCSNSEFKRFYRKGRPFRFEAMWLKDNSCKGVIRDSWDSRQPSYLVWGFNRKIMACQENLKVWNRTTFGHVRSALKRKLADLKEAEEGDCYRTNPRCIQMLRKEIGSLQSREGCMWKQRARNTWLKESDRNTAYFHCRANQRNKRNLIMGLGYDNGVWVEDEADLGGVVEGYFKNIFSTSNPSGLDRILNGILYPGNVEVDPCVGGEFQAFEVKQALDQMTPNVAPGPNGMSPIFYKSFWHIVGEDVTAVLLQALNSGIVPESLNSTFISLIPKVKNPKKVSEF